MRGYDAIKNFRFGCRVDKFYDKGMGFCNKMLKKWFERGNLGLV